jgi:hypothetical protein
MDIAAFLDAFNADDPEAAVTGVSWRGDDVVVEVEVFRHDDTAVETTRKFKIVCSGVAETQVALSGFLCAEWSADHPALLRYNEPRGTLYFSSAPADPQAVIGRLWQVSQDVYRGYRTMADDFNLNGYHLVDLLAGGHGQLAVAPLSVVARYVEAIGGAMATNVVAGPVPQGGYRILDFQGDCYVICRVAAVPDTAEILMFPAH